MFRLFVWRLTADVSPVVTHALCLPFGLFDAADSRATAYLIDLIVRRHSEAWPTFYHKLASRGKTASCNYIIFTCRSGGQVCEEVWKPVHCLLYVLREVWKSFVHLCKDCHYFLLRCVLFTCHTVKRWVPSLLVQTHSITQEEMVQLDCKPESSEMLMLMDVCRFSFNKGRNDLSLHV